MIAPPTQKISGFQCPRCKSMESKVVYTTAYGDKRYRERTCKKCEYPYITLESVIK